MQQRVSEVKNRRKAKNARQVLSGKVKMSSVFSITIDDVHSMKSQYTRLGRTTGEQP